MPSEEPLELIVETPVERRAIVRVIAVQAGVLAVFFLVMVKLVPKGTKIFKDFDADLPAMTMLVIEFSWWIASYWFVGLFLGLCVVTGLVVLILLGCNSAARRINLSIVGASILWYVFVLLAMSLPLIALMQKLG